MPLTQQFPASYDLDVYKGSYFFRKFISKSGTPLAPNDLTGYTVRCQIRDRVGGTIILTPNVQIGVAISGEILLEILATDSTPITQTRGVYDIELVPTALGEGKAVRFIEGQVFFYNEVTKQ